MFYEISIKNKSVTYFTYLNEQFNDKTTEIAQDTIKELAQRKVSHSKLSYFYLMQLGQDQKEGNFFRGKFEKAFRYKKETSELFSSDYTYCEIQLKIEKLISHLHLCKNQDAQRLWENNWYPEGLKASLLNSAINGLGKSKVFKQLVENPEGFYILADISALAALPLLSLFLSQNQLKEGLAKDILQKCAKSSGILILPYLLDYKKYFNSEFFHSLLHLALDHTTKEHIVAIDEEDRSVYLHQLSLKKEIFQKLKQVLEGFLSDKPFHLLYQAEKKVDLFIRRQWPDREFQCCWKLYQAEPTESNRKMILEFIEDLEEREPSINLQIKKTLLFKELEKEDRAGFALRQIALFKLSKEEILDILAEAKIYRDEVIVVLDNLSLTPKEIVEFLKKFPLKNFPVVWRIKILHELKISMRDEEICDYLLKLLNNSDLTDLKKIQLDFIPNEPTHILYQKVFLPVVKDYLENPFKNYKNGEAIFFKPHRLALPSFINISLFSLGQLIWVNTIDTGMHLNDCALEVNFLANCHSQMERIKKQSPLFGRALEKVWKQVRLEQLLKELYKINEGRYTLPNYQQQHAKKMREIVEASRSFKDLIRSYYLTEYVLFALYDKDLIFKRLAEGISLAQTLFTSDLRLNQEAIGYVAKLVVEFPHLELSSANLPAGSFKAFYPILFYLVGRQLDVEWLSEVFTREIQEQFFSLIHSLSLSFSEKLAQFFISELEKAKEEGLANTQLTAYAWQLVAFFNVLHANKQEALLEKICDEKDAKKLEASAKQLFLEHFALNETEINRLTSLKSLPQILSFYYQWEKSENIIKPFMKWLKAVLNDKQQIEALRFEHGPHGEFFSKLDPTLVKRYKEEIDFDCAELSKAWNKGFSLREEASSFAQLCHKHINSLFVFDSAILEKMGRTSKTQLCIDELKIVEESFWKEYKENAQRHFNKDQIAQRYVTHQINALRALQKLLCESDLSLSCKYLIEFQNRLSDCNKYKSLGSLDTINKEISRLESALKAQGKDLFQNLSIRFTHDTHLIFTIADLSSGNCQGIIRGANMVFNSTLVAKVTHGKNKLLVIEDSLTCQPIGYILVKIVLNKNNQPFLHAQPLMQCVGCPFSPRLISEMAIFALLSEAKRLQLPLLIAKYEDSLHEFEIKSSDYFTVAPCKEPMSSFTGIAMQEYENAGHMRILEGESFVIPRKYLLETTLRP